MITRYARNHRPAELTFRDITGRLVINNFGAIHQTSMSITNLVFDIVASDDKFNTVALLREEIETVYLTRRMDKNCGLNDDSS